MKEKIIAFLKKETVLSIAMLLALLSAFLVPPDLKYVDYIDFRTLAILFCLMAVMAGYSKIGVFSRLANYLLRHVKGIRSLISILILLCFFTSMLITNDVALITFVPFTFIVLQMLGSSFQEKWLIPIIAMQTIAANLGSMFTPIGNPQNLYLYGKSGLQLVSFLQLMLPYSTVSLFLITCWILFFCRKEKDEIEVALEQEETEFDCKKCILHTILFVCCLLTVAKIMPCWITFVIVLLSFLLTERKLLKQVDYSLLLTFVGFFVFIGNIGRVEAVHRWLQNIVKGKEVVTAILCSQAMSNVPAALLLSGFTNRYEQLVIGTNLGGLGTLIASMASLISFKYVARQKHDKRGRYIAYFTVSNIVFLILLFLFYLFISR